MALAHTAMAQDANVTTGATSAKLGGEFRAEWTHDDHGFEKATGYTPDATDTIAVQAANLKLAGNINKDTEFAMRFNLLDPSPYNGGPLQYGYGTHWFSKMIGFSMGKMKVAQGGWDTWGASYRDMASGVYSDNLAFNEYENMIELQLKVAGTVRLQLLNDVSTNVNPYDAKAGSGEWNQGAHPTWVLGWQGEFGAIKPLVDLGSFDNNKSRWIDLGVATEMSGLAASLDIYMLDRVHKAADADGKAKELTDSAMAVTLNASYSIKGTASPFLFFSTFDNKQGEDSDLGTKDAKVNSVTPATASTPASMNWDDNGQTIAVGTTLDMMGKNFNPYFAIVSQSGKFADAAGKEETKSNMWIKIGVLGEI